MRKTVGLISFFFALLAVSYLLYTTGQEHTLVFNNIYNDKTESKNLVLKISGEKDRKINKNRKVVVELKGKNQKFIIENGEQIKEAEVNFSLNRGVEVEIEKFLNSEENWMKEIGQY